MPTSEVDASHWKRLHPVTILFGIVATIWRVVIPLVLGTYMAAKDPFFLLFFITLFVVFPLVGQLMRYFSYRYACWDGNIQIREGILSRNVRTIPVMRIHNINTSQNLAARIFGVVRLEIETAGGAKAEAAFAMLGLDEATAIQNFVRLGKQDGNSEEPSSETGESVEPQPEVLHRVPLPHVILAGATSGKIGVIAFGLLLLSQYMEYAQTNRPAEWLLGQVQGLAEGQSENMLMMVVLTFTFLLLGAWLFGIGSALVRWYGFTLAREERDLKISAGLFTLRQFTIPLLKVQGLRLSCSSLRRPFKLFQIQVRSAGHVGIEEQSRVESDLLVPVTHRNDVETFVRYVFPEAELMDVTWQETHIFGRNFPCVIWTLICCALTILIYWVPSPLQGAAWVPGVMALILVFLFVMEHLDWRQRAYAYDANFLYLRTGSIGRYYWVIPRNKIQNILISQTPGQRRRNLASLTLDLAGPPSPREPHITYIPLAEAWHLFNLFLSHGGPRP